jgi:hypothetical protein
MASVVQLVWVAMNKHKEKNMAKKEPEANTCPNCGYCPHCGRGGWGVLPYYPRPWYPYYPTGPTWISHPTSTTCDGTLTIINNAGDAIQWTNTA